VYNKAIFVFYQFEKGWYKNMKKFAALLIAVLVSLAVLPCYAEESATPVAPVAPIAPDTPVSSTPAEALPEQEDIPLIGEAFVGTDAPIAPSPDTPIESPIAPDSVVSSSPDTPISSEDAKDAVDYDTAVDGSLSFDSGVTGEFQTTGSVGALEMGGESEIAASEANSEFKFEPKNFVDNLAYMGIGMVGIFIVIGIIVLATVLLNKLFREKSDKAQ
jgi:hypothetical protein